MESFFKVFLIIKERKKREKENREEENREEEGMNYGQLLAKVFESDLDPKRIIDQLNFYRNLSINITDDLVIFDEIQAIPKAITSLKYFQEDMPQLAICSAGSLLGVKLNHGSFPVGKVHTMFLYPMDFVEFLHAIGENLSADLIETCKIDTVIPPLAHDRIWECLKWYFVVGGLPEAVNCFIENKDNLFVAFEKVRSIQLQLITDYYADMAKHSGKVNAMHIDRIWLSIPNQLASHIDSSSKRYQFHGVVEGIDRYSRLANAIDWLENAGLVIKVPVIHDATPPLSAHTKENHFKLFVFDVGVLGALSGLSPKTIHEYDYGTYEGFFAENFVAQEFISSNCKELFTWQDGRSEVEFIRNIEGDILPIEVKSGTVTHAKSLQKFMEKYHCKYRTIMSGRPLLIDLRNGFENYPLYLASRFPLSKS